MRKYVSFRTTWLVSHVKPMSALKVPGVRLLRWWDFNLSRDLQNRASPLQTLSRLTLSISHTQTSKLRRLDRRFPSNSKHLCSFLHTSTQAQASKLSYVHGASSIPLLGSTIGEQLQKKVESHPDKDAMIFYKDKIKLTFSELLEKADMLAAGLLSMGIGRGDRLGIWGPNTVEWVITQYATARAGIILVNINPAYRASELKYCLEKSGCKGLVAACGFKDLNYMDMLRELVPELDTTPEGAPVKSKKLPDLQFILTMGQEKHAGTLRFNDVLTMATPSQRQSLFDIEKELQFDDPINIQFTSGTTGSPKGSSLTHHGIVNNSYFVGLRCGYHEHDAIINVPVPLYHCFGMVIGSMQSVTHGATLVWPSPIFDPEHVLKALEIFKCTSLYGVPTMFIDLLNHPQCKKTNTSSLITGVMAGSPCPIETVKEVLEQLNMHKFTVCYGSTETSPVSFQSTVHCPVEKRVSTVGKVLDHIEAKIVDSQGWIVPVGTPGEVCTRGSNTMLGYWNDSEKSALVITPAQWYHTGDIGVMSEDGYCSITGRIKDMLIRGGENIYPLEIEQILYMHPKIKDVQVIGVPDKRLGEQVCAWIVVKENMTLTETEVRDFCKDHMARFKIPQYVMFVEDFPKTVTGKVQKFKMREESTKILGL